MTSISSSSRWTNADLGRTEVRDTYRADLRPGSRDVFADARPLDFSRLTWKEAGRPFRVENWSRSRREWEAQHEESLPVPVAWQLFNRSFQSLFDADPVRARVAALRTAGMRISSLQVKAAYAAISEVARWTIWNQAHRVGDTVWDPRAKRSLFEGLDLERPRILFLGAAEGYEAMLLSAMYPGGEVVLVDYDEFCVEGRFGAFPTDYPFLGVNPATGARKVWHRDEMDISYLVSDIRDLDFGKEFDVVVSIGLVEHFPDQYKPMAFDWHRRFLRPGGYAILTTPRVALRTKAFYRLFGDLMNFSYRELQNVAQLGLYAHENGFEVLRHGEIKSHNGIICRSR
ncbi:class I SAM-dependent methyltransferase [Actinoalloteichus hymeniacidonis]|uniref:Methyltransferase domain n=1 Tax=Actinoalloteichus hymeniacidonis TaxID=340345 RepID=A0AAC9HKC9_9PSEU|nr:class I SAM-dependent methyltransferase [Actinoalloteichus hymeniacidonis]AOS60889.1 Methyltransferase domain [Actinoalloteichus hymeniacidonis]MBB5911111.1 SAM-dependent methyltransferase [Actinoalloteichus hymeniacidonis]